MYSVAVVNKAADGNKWISYQVKHNEKIVKGSQSVNGFTMHSTAFNMIGLTIGPGSHTFSLEYFNNHYGKPYKDEEPVPGKN